MEWNVSDPGAPIWHFYSGLQKSGYWLAQGGGLDEATWEKLRKNLDYYEKSPEEKALPEIAEQTLGFGVFMDMLRIAGVAVLVIALVFIILRLVSGKRKKTRLTTTESDPTEAELSVAETPLDVLWNAFHKARENHQYRQALRLLYQINIKKLSLAGMVVAHTDKTNWEYVAEITDQTRSDHFAGITRVYEQSWYGDGVLSALDFQRHEPVFMNFIKSLPDAK